MTREQQSMERMERMAHRMADTLRWYADDPDTDAFSGEGYSDELRALADRLDSGTATDEDWDRAMDELDPRI